MSYKPDTVDNTKTSKVTSLHIYEQTNPTMKLITLRRVVEELIQYA